MTNQNTISFENLINQLKKEYRISNTEEMIKRLKRSYNISQQKEKMIREWIQLREQMSYNEGYKKGRLEIQKEKIKKKLPYIGVSKHAYHQAWKETFKNILIGSYFVFCFTIGTVIRYCFIV